MSTRARSVTDHTLVCFGYATSVADAAPSGTYLIDDVPERVRVDA
jgi:hypothetical protein